MLATLWILTLACTLTPLHHFCHVTDVQVKCASLHARFWAAFWVCKYYTAFFLHASQCVHTQRGVVSQGTLKHNPFHSLFTFLPSGKRKSICCCCTTSSFSSGCAVSSIQPPHSGTNNSLVVFLCACTEGCDLCCSWTNRWTLNPLKKKITWDCFDVVEKSNGQVVYLTMCPIPNSWQMQSSSHQWAESSIYRRENLFLGLPSSPIQP